MSEESKVTPTERVSDHVEDCLKRCFRIVQGSRYKPATVVVLGDGIFMNAEEFGWIIETLYGKGFVKNTPKAVLALEAIGKVPRTGELLKLGQMLYLSQGTDGRFQIYGKTTPTSRSGRRIAQLRWRSGAPQVFMIR